MLDYRHLAASHHAAALYSYALLLALGLSYAAYISPLNVNDFLMHLFMFETQSVSRTFQHAFIDPPAYPEWRPLQLLTAQIIYKFLAQGHEHLVFKGMLVGSLFLTVGLFVRLLEVRSWIEVLAAAIALLVLLGHHSFAGAVEGIYPYGVEIVLLACELAVLNILLRREPSLASQTLAVAISIFAILLNEKGGLVGVTYIVGSALRLPGGTRRSAAVLFAVYLAILFFRFLWVSPPSSLMGRSAATGYLGIAFDTLAPVLNLLISDPRIGEFTTIPQAVAGRPWAVIYLTSSFFLSALIVVWAWFTWQHAEESRRDELKVAAILPFLLMGSAMFGPFSRKDYVPIMALAGYAVVSFYALKWLFAETLRARRLAAYWLLLALAGSLALSWSIRAAGLFYYLRHQAFNYQFEWAFRVDRLGKTHEFDPAMTEPIIARLRPQALSRPLNHPHAVFPRQIMRLMLGRECPEVCRKSIDGEDD